MCECVFAGQTRGAWTRCEFLTDDLFIEMIFRLTELPVISCFLTFVCFSVQGFPGLMGEKGDRGERGDKVSTECRKSSI